MKTALLLLVLQAANVLFFYGFYVAGKFSEFCASEQNVADAKLLGRYEKRLVTLVAAHPRRGIYGFLLCAKLAYIYPDLIAIMTQSRRSCVTEDTDKPKDASKNISKGAYDYL